MISSSLPFCSQLLSNYILTPIRINAKAVVSNESGRYVCVMTEARLILFDTTEGTSKKYVIHHPSSSPSPLLFFCLLPPLTKLINVKQHGSTKTHNLHMCGYTSFPVHCSGWRCKRFHLSMVRGVIRVVGMTKVIKAREGNLAW